MDNKIFMHFPIEIEKAEDGSYKRVIVKGKASTPHQDKQGEWIDPMGCDIDDFKRISDDHIKGNSGTIGEIIKAHKDHEAVWIDEAELYPELKQVQHIVKLADALKKRPNSKMQLSFSIEGSATERDSINPKRILKAKLTGAAVTLQPINSNATAELFAKSLNYDDTDFDALEKSDSIEQRRYLYEWKDSDGVEYKLTKSFEIEKGTYVDDAENRKLGRVGQHYGSETNLKQDSHGKLYETVKFSNGIEEQHYSDKLHKLNFIADKNGLDLDNYKDFQRAEEILKEKGKPNLNQMSSSAKDVYDILTSKKGEYVTDFTGDVKSRSAVSSLNGMKDMGAKELIDAGIAEIISNIDGYRTIKLKQNNKTQKSTTAELEDDDSEDVLKKEELKKKTVSLIAKAIEEKRISKEKGKKMLKHFLNQ